MHKGYVGCLAGQNCPFYLVRCLFMNTICQSLYLQLLLKMQIDEYGFVSGPDISNLLFIVSIFSPKCSWKLSRLLRPSFCKSEYFRSKWNSFCSSSCDWRITWWHHKKAWSLVRCYHKKAWSWVRWDSKEQTADTLLFLF